jgi:hypothetical protein
MPYIINTTNGAEIATVADGTINNTTDITLIGKNYAGYGEILNENFVKLLENFANSSSNPPGAPLPGQLWYDTTNSSIRVYISNAIGFKPLAKLISSSSAPINNAIGDLWWDSTNGQLKVFNGLDHTTVGPAASTEFGSTGAQPELIVDTAAVDHYVVSLYSASTRVAIVSKDPVFTPNLPIPGFSVIRPGINLASTGTVAGIQMTGLASNADLLDDLNSTDFLRANANTTTSGTFGILNDTGLSVGVDSDFRASVSGVNVTLANQTTNGNLSLKVAGNISPSITINGVSGLTTVLADPTDALGVATKAYVDNISAAGTSLRRDGTNTITGVIRPDGDGAINFGATANKFATIFATAFSGSTVTANANTASTSTTSGALIVTGGAGIGGNLYAGGAAVRFTGGIASTSISSGTLVVTGGTGVSGNLHVGGTAVRLTGDTASTSTSTGTLVVTGGTGVTGNLYAGGGAVRFTGNTSSTSTTTGTLVVTGGAGVSGNLFVGETLSGTTLLGNVTSSGTSSFSTVTVSTLANVTATTASTSTTTGALRVAGGVGISGALNVGGDVTAFATSDQRLKENVAIIESALEKISSIRGVTFNWNQTARDLGKPGTDREVGVIAQDLEKVLPEVVRTRDDGYLAVQYEKLVPLLIESIKDLKKEIDELKKQ